MKNYFKLGLVLLAISLYSCGGGSEANNDGGNTPANPNASATESTGGSDANSDLPSHRVVLDDKGVGPVTSLTISDDIDQAMAAEGQEIYESHCTSCHKPAEKFIGPAPKGILERRSPEWVMNMIINPDKMLQENALAKELLEEFNGSPMSNQGIDEEEARAILEYFRTL
ncbi:MAG: c-type cytochrome [Brumimicrobium sp.]|nr:c-type cytochrome [Brumimicrobium sp.]MCO5268017.1 cytochrome c [Brumimicrobium sp.]